MQEHTAFDRTMLASDVLAMGGGVPRPERVRGYLNDLARNRQLAPLGKSLEIAEAWMDDNAPYSSVSRPFQRVIAHIKRRYRGKMSRDMKAAIVEAKRESDEAEAASLVVACSSGNPLESDLLRTDKEVTEAILALENLKDITEERLCEIQEAR